jgi:hypothetical protein
MKLRDLLKRGPRVKPLPPIKTVQSPALVRKERVERERAARDNGGADERSVAPNSGPARNPGAPAPKKIDPIFEDTGSLELTKEPDEKGNPYDTQSWQMDPRKGLRRVDNLNEVNREPVDKDVVTNPYDTGIIRKGW